MEKGEGMSVNNAGGFSFVVSDMQRLHRFLCLGCEGGTYYQKEKELGLENATAVTRMLTSGLGLEVVKEVVAYSVDGRTAKQDPIIFVLAIACRMGDEETKKAAYEALPSVLRIPTHLFKFLDFCEKLSVGSGWGRAHRRAVSAWYQTKEASNLAFLMTKYQQREGWAHRDALRLAHPVPPSEAHKLLFKYAAKDWAAVKDTVSEDPAVKQALEFLGAVELCKSCDEAVLLELIPRFHLAREHIPNAFFSSPAVWNVLLGSMGMTALLRNLAKMTQVGLLQPGNDRTAFVCEKLRSHDLLRKARVHPFNILVALATYRQGKGEKGKLTWTPVPEIVDALDDAFYASFAFVEPTNRRHLLALDVSGSMTCGGVIGSNALNPREASAALAMTTLRTEPHCLTLGFSDTLVPVPITKSMKLDEVISTIGSISMGGTDCALPMLWAAENKVFVDVFIVYTDNETWFGKVHPHEALKQYRAKTGIAAKLIVMGMTATEFSIADPTDAGMLDMAGFDANGPVIISDFVTDKL